MEYIEHSHGKIVVSYSSPPIPTNCFDWCAYWDNYDIDGPYAHGSSKEEAIENLLEITDFEEI
jgi:hypothetical protein